MGWKLLDVLLLLRWKLSDDTEYWLLGDECSDGLNVLLNVIVDYLLLILLLLLLLILLLILLVLFVVSIVSLILLFILFIFLILSYFNY